jgi:hypothetical protein
MSAPGGLCGGTIIDEAHIISVQVSMSTPGGLCGGTIIDEANTVLSLLRCP